MRKSKLVINRKSSSATTSVVLLVLAILFISMGKFSIIMPLALSNMEMIKYFAMPVIACVLFLLCILLFAKKGFFLSVIPLVIAAVSTMIKSFEIGSVIGYAEVAICIVLIVIYCCTMFGAMRRFFFAAITIILMAFNAYFVVYHEITTTIYTFTMLSYEVGILFMYLAFIFAVCGATRQNKIKPETATVVAPPIPGNSILNDKKNSAVSDPEPIPEPIKEAEIIPAEIDEPTKDIEVVSETNDAVATIGEGVEVLDNALNTVSTIIEADTANDEQNGTIAPENISETKTDADDSISNTEEKIETTEADLDKIFESNESEEESKKSFFGKLFNK